RTAQAARPESPAVPPAGLSVCEAYTLLGSMLCLKHKIPDRPLFEQYERLDEDLKAELPLKRVWMVASQEDGF
ncbi:hypothetical protein, partial [Burkholderia multivorans]